MLDDNFPERIDHLGWRLWIAARWWKATFEARMGEAGYGWFSEAKSGLLGHLGSEGAKQSDLARATGLSKQAVQQHVDELVLHGAVRRQASAADARVRIVRLTAKGLAAARAANAVKSAIEGEARAKLGDDRTLNLLDALSDLADGQTSAPQGAGKS